MDQKIGKNYHLIRSDVKIWTFEIRGGSEFLLEFKYQPNLEYQGERVLWKFLGTSGESEYIKKAIEQRGCSVVLYTEAETPKQELIRKFRLGDFSDLFEKEMGQ